MSYAWWLEVGGHNHLPGMPPVPSNTGAQTTFIMFCESEALTEGLDLSFQHVGVNPPAGNEVTPTKNLIENCRVLSFLLSVQPALYFTLL